MLMLSMWRSMAEYMCMRLKATIIITRRIIKQHSIMLTMLATPTVKTQGVGLSVVAKRMVGAVPAKIATRNVPRLLGNFQLDGLLLFITNEVITPYTPKN